MRAMSSVRRGLDLLSRRDRRLYVAAVILQSLTALLDFLGIVMIGAIAYLALTSIQDNPLPGRIKGVIDAVGLGSRPLPQVTIVVAGVAALLLILKSVLALYLTRRTLQFLAHRQGIVASALTARLFAQSLTTVQARSSQETAYALTIGVSAATVGLLGSAAIGVSEIALMALLTLLLLFVSPLLTIATVAYFLLIAFVLQRFMGQWAGNVGIRSSASGVASITAIQEGIGSYRELATSGRRGVYRDQVRAGLWQLATSRADGLFVQQVPKYVLEAALVVGALILAVTQLLMGDPDSAVATLAIFVTAAIRIMPSILRLQGALIVIRGSAGEAQRAFDLDDSLNAHHPGQELEEHRGSVLVASMEKGYDGFEPDIVLIDISLTYPGSTGAALRDLTLSVPHGTSLAIVGTTGAGKSTLADVILGVLEPTTGVVRVGGLSPREAVHRWPGGVAYVPQSVGLVDGSIALNVALGLRDDLIDEARVWRALERARLADFVKDHPTELHTLIGEHGTRLSGGQRQRLGLARALYSDPRLLVLDEATSALDSQTEQAVTDALSDLAGDVTVVTIAHRLATIRTADRVAYLDEGHLVTVGTFDEVRAHVRAFDEQATLLGLN